MPDRMQQMGALSGPIAMVLIFGGLLIAGFLPPLAPTLSAEMVAAHYQNHTLTLKICSASMLLSASLNVFFYGTLSAQIRRIEGPVPVLSYGNMLLGLFSLIPGVIASAAIAAAAFRPELPATAIMNLNDIVWLCLVTLISPASVQFGVLGIAILRDRHETPLFPRWLGYVTLWCAVLFLPGIPAMFLRTGPFAWNGILAFWIPAIVFGTWINVAAWALFKAAARSDYPMRS